MDTPTVMLTGCLSVTRPSLKKLSGSMTLFKSGSCFETSRKMTEVKKTYPTQTRLRILHYWMKFSGTLQDSQDEETIKLNGLSDFGSWRLLGGTVGDILSGYTHMTR